MQLDRLNWNDLRYFLEVARKGRLQGAAKRLGVNHTTVARRIAALEASLETRLFERTAHGFDLTSAGETLFPLAQQVENAADYAKESVHHSGNVLSGNLRIGTPDGFGNAFLADAIVPFVRDNPGLTIELAPVPLSHNLSKREVDMAIRLEKSAQSNIDNIKITEYTLYLYTTNKYIKDNNLENASYDDLKNEILSDYIADILYSDELNFNQYLGGDIASRFQSSTVLAQQAFIAGGGGVGVLPYFMAMRDSRLIPVFTDRISFVRSYWLLVPLELQRMASVRRLQNFILFVTKENRRIFMPEKAPS